MKKVFLGMAACAMLCACSSDDIVSIADQGAAYNGEAVYMTVNIKDVGDASTRATAGDFAYGSESERSISSAHFYFFDENENYMTKTQVGSITGEATSQESPIANVEWESGTTLALYGLGEDMYPKYMVTVLNQPASFGDFYGTLSDFRALLANANGVYKEGNDFVMSTSAYWDGSNTYRNDALSITTILEPTDFRDEPIAIESDYGQTSPAVDVYVERLAAKAQMQIAGTLTDGQGNSLTTNNTVYVSGEGRTTEHTYTAFKASGIYDDIENADENIKDLYIAFKGWTLNGTARDSYLMKNVDTDWNAGNLWSTSGTSNTNGSFNDVQNHRSYWAMSPNYDDGDHVYPESAVKDSTVSYIGNTDADEEDEETMLDSYLRYTSLNDRCTFGSTDFAYCAENTNTAGNNGVLQNNRSTAITNALVLAQAGTLSSSVLTPVDLVKWEGELFTVEEFLDKIAADASNIIMTQTLNEVLEALSNETFVNWGLGLADLNTDDLKALADACEHGLYVSQTQMTTSTSSENLQLFDGSFLNLVNHGNGYVGVRVNAATATAKYGSATTGTMYYPATWYHASDVTGKDVTIAEEYQKEGSYTWLGSGNHGDGAMTANSDWTPAYEATNTLDAASSSSNKRAYMYFKLDESKVDGTLLNALNNLGLVVTTQDSQALLYVNESTTIQDAYHGTQEQASSGGYYNLAEYTVWAIERECQNIIDYWEAHAIKPNLMKDGLMYYTVPIQHVNNTYGETLNEGNYGVVRNHWYSLTVNSVSQLGHGIADLEEVIVPSPEDEYKYLGVDLNILSWKMVNQSVGF